MAPAPILRAVWHRSEAVRVRGSLLTVECSQRGGKERTPSVLKYYPEETDTRILFVPYRQGKIFECKGFLSEAPNGGGSSM